MFKNYKRLYEEEKNKNSDYEWEIPLLKKQLTCIYSKMDALSQGANYSELSKTFSKTEIMYGFLYTFKLLNDVNNVHTKLRVGDSTNNYEDDLLCNFPKHLASALARDSLCGCYHLQDVVNELKKVLEHESDFSPK